MPQFEDFLASLVTIKDKKDWSPGTDNSCTKNSFRRSWGFTIYRTAYSGPDSDRLWRQILDDIHNGVTIEANEPRRAHGSDQNEADEVMSLFRLLPASNEARLAGLNLYQMREIYLQDAAGPDEVNRPVNWRPGYVGSHLFLLVDDEVMEAAAAQQENEAGLWVKCVDADYKAEDYVPRNTRVRQTFFGWMKMTTRCLVSLWEDLFTFHPGGLQRLAPVMSDDIGEDSVIYDGDVMDFQFEEQQKPRAG